VSAGGRVPSGAGGGVFAAAKADRQRRESFKPRPSVEAPPMTLAALGVSGYGYAVVKEEEEDDESVF
jgi:hypothetical protein